MSDVPEADAMEQEIEVDPGKRIDPVNTDPEVPEADAIDQATEIEPEHEQL